MYVQGKKLSMILSVQVFWSPQSHFHFLQKPELNSERKYVCLYLDVTFHISIFFKEMQMLREIRNFSVKIFSSMQCLHLQF